MTAAHADRVGWFQGQIPKLLILVGLLWFGASFPGVEESAEGGFQVLDERAGAAGAAGHRLAADRRDGGGVFAVEVNPSPPSHRRTVTRNLISYQ